MRPTHRAFQVLSLFIFSGPFSYRSPLRRHPKLAGGEKESRKSFLFVCLLPNQFSLPESQSSGIFHLDFKGRGGCSLLLLKLLPRAGGGAVELAAPRNTTQSQKHLDSSPLFAPGIGHHVSISEETLSKEIPSVWILRESECKVTGSFFLPLSTYGHIECPSFA